jgi:rubrerythrin
MLVLKELSSADLARVCRQAGQECSFRYGQISRAADPSDRALQDLLMRMARETQLQADAIEGEAAAGSSLSSVQIRETLRTELPSLTKGFGEGVLHRDIALFYAESLEEEASRFYRTLAGHAREWQVREHCFDLSERERGKLRFLREVVLQS